MWAFVSRIGERTRSLVEAMGLEPMPENLGKRSDLPPIGVDGREVVVGSEPRIQALTCSMAEIWGEYDQEELRGLYCLVDPSKM